ncbi:MAG: Tol-Pal system beta propeller repeat protein TolB [Myxococcota bacterium]
MRAAVLAALLAVIGLTAHAQEPPARTNVLIDIGKPGDRAVPIALPKPTGGSPQSQEVWDVVKRDLELSGWFDVIDPNAYLEPAGAGLRPGEFDFADWRPTGAAVLAKTSAANSDKLRSEVWIYGVADGQKLGAKAFSGSPESPRAVGHRIANEIVKAVTGHDGFFDTKFAFVGNFSGNKEIYTVDVDGHGRRQITRDGSIHLKPRWNKAGNAIAFTGYQNGNPDLYVADLVKGAIRRVSSRSGINTGGAFSPLGNLLALTLSVAGDAEIFTIDPVAGREIARLTKNPGIDVSPSFSPDGSQIAFVSERSGGPQIYVMNADGSGARRVTFQGNHNVDPSWSPAGDRIAFVGRDKGFDVFTVRLDGTGMERITQGAGDNEDPSWSPDGEYVAFSSTRTGSAHIWIASADGRHQIQATTGAGGYTNPHWSNHLSW